MARPLLKRTPLPMHYFNSTAVHSADYNLQTGTLRIWFTSSGQPYDYYNVPVHVWNGFTAASSAGTYFNHFIRDQYAA